MLRVVVVDSPEHAGRLAGDAVAAVVAGTFIVSELGDKTMLATFALAARVGVPGWAHPFAVGLLEVVAVAGTWIWMTDPRLRLEAAAAVGMQVASSRARRRFISDPCGCARRTAPPRRVPPRRP